MQPRPATPADVPACQALLEDVAAWLAERGRPLWHEEELDPAHLSAAQAAGELFVLVDAGGVAATVCVTSRDELFWPEDEPGTASYVHRLAVRRDAAGRGLSTLMLDYAADVARARGHRYLKLDCDPRPELRGLYERHGFTPLDVIRVGQFDAARYVLQVR